MPTPQLAVCLGAKTQSRQSHEINTPQALDSRNRKLWLGWMFCWVDVRHGSLLLFLEVSDRHHTRGL